MVPYKVEVNLRRVNNNKIHSVWGKIVAFISDEHRHSVPFRAGSMLFTHTEGTGQDVDGLEARLTLQRSVVVVPSGWVLGIEVNLCIKIKDENNHQKPFFQDKPLKATLIFDKENLSQSQTPKGTGIEIKGTIAKVEDMQTITRVEDMQHFPAQLSRPVEVIIERICNHRFCAKH